MLDALLHPQGPNCPFPPKGRSISVPLTKHTTWVSEEAPKSLGGVDLRPGKKKDKVSGGGSHLPATMQRLGLLPTATQPPRLLPAGRLGSLKDLAASHVASTASPDPYSGTGPDPYPAPDRYQASASVPPTNPYNDPRSPSPLPPRPASLPAGDAPQVCVSSYARVCKLLRACLYAPTRKSVCSDA